MIPSIGTPPQMDAPASPPTKLFISYARQDLNFVDEIVGGLELAQFHPLIDRHAIMGGDDWKRRIGNLIAEADIFIFILTPASVVSEQCAREISEATQLSKRILPVLARPLGDARPPAPIPSLNYVRFDDGSTFTTAMKVLVRAIKADLDWINQHTRLLARAQDWHGAGRPANRLLLGVDVEDAKRWAARRPNDSPELTGLHHEFIHASEQASLERESVERRRAHRAIAGMFAAILLAFGATGSAYYAYLKRQESEIQRSKVEAVSRSLGEIIVRPLESNTTEVRREFRSVIGEVAASADAAVFTQALFDLLKARDTYRVQLGVLVGLSKIKGGWQATDGQRNFIEELMKSMDKRDAAYRDALIAAEKNMRKGGN